MAGKIKEIQQADFEKEVLGKQRVVVDFYSTECPPCEALASKYESLSNIYGDDVSFIKIFRQGNRELAENLDVSGSPTVLFYQDGEITGPKLSGGIKRSELMEGLDALLPAEKADAIHGKIEPAVTNADVVVLGGGPAGLTAGLYLAQAHLNTIVVDTALPGGYVATTHQVSNYPGFVEPQPGMMLSHYMSEQAKANGVEFRSAVEVSKIDLVNKSILVDGYETIEAKKIVIATGSRPRPLGIDGEKEFAGQGISYCATCDGKYFEDREIVVIGGGNSAIEESLFLSKFAKKITIVHQFDTLQANREAQHKIMADPKVNIMFEHEPREFKKYGNMDMGVVVENLKTGRKEELRTDGIFVFVGFIPNLDMFSDKMELDQWGYLKSGETMETSIPGVFAAGDVRTKQYRQITTAVADGTIAAITISKELT